MSNCTNHRVGNGKSRRERSVIDLLDERRTLDSSREAFRFRSETSWDSRTWSEVATTVDRLAAGLIVRGFQAGAPASIAASTSYEWICADLAIMSAGGTVTTIYPSSKLDDFVHILSDSGARVVFAENEVQLELLRQAKVQLPSQIDLVVSFTRSDDDEVVYYGDLIDEGAIALREDAELVSRRSEALTPDAPASILYTSGTTGSPKGVVLTHGSWLYELEALDELSLFSANDVQFLWLPLAHAFGKLLALVSLKTGLCTAVDGNIDNIADNLRETQPTFMCAVPRALDKVRAKVTAQIESSSAARRRLAQWAIEVGARADSSTAGKDSPSRWVQAQHRVADALVLKKIRDAFGGRLRLLVSGSAPLDASVGEWFSSIGITVLEGYGLTESGAATTLSRPGEIEWGTVGKPLDGTNVKIADDGEVLIKGPGVMRGYLNNDMATDEAVANGWFHTGDIGKFTPVGNLQITDRKKNVFKTANGKFVAPGPMEAKFMALCPFASQIVITGEHRRFVSALIALSAADLEPWAKENNVVYSGFADLTGTREVRELIEGYVDELNAELNRWEQIKKVAIVPREFTIEDGDLTPSLKLRRKAVEGTFADTIEHLYRK